MSELIDSIQIQGYRCFEDTTVSGFGRVNLIGGLNNSGKTALLEALYIATQYKANKTIPLSAAKTTLATRENSKDVNKYYSTLFNKNFIEKFIQIYLSNDKQYEIVNYTIYKKDHESTFTATGYGDWDSDLASNYSCYLPAKLDYNAFLLMDIFSELEDSGQQNFVVDIVKEIDSRILDLRTRSSGTDIGVIMKGVNGQIPLISLGDYVKKVLLIALRSWKSKPKYILIDEIENGIHYTKHKGFWEFLFRLAINQNCQIFAATHSREMIEAYLSVIQENGWEQEARYFEMYRHVQTDKIMAQVKPIDILEYRLEQNLPFRGEATQS